MKEFNTNTLEQLKLWAYEYVKGNYEGFNELEDAVEYLDDFFKYVYDNIILKSDIKLYRVIVADNIKNINVNNIGIHTVLDSKLLYDSDFLEDIGIDSYMENDVKLYIIEITTSVNNINWEHTIDTRLRFPQEMEITLKKDCNCIVKILNYDKTKIV